jgi:hypothetical protein
VENVTKKRSSGLVSLGLRVEHQNGRASNLLVRIAADVVEEDFDKDAANVETDQLSGGRNKTENTQEINDGKCGEQCGENSDQGALLDAR